MTEPEERRQIVIEPPLSREPPEWAQGAVPHVAPEPSVALAPQGRGALLYYRFPEVPGVPEHRHNIARAFVAEVEDESPGCSGDATAAEWLAIKNSLACELERADYHWVRFWDCLAIIRARRAVVGGPVVSDPSVARAILCEASAYLSCCRTSVDILIRAAGRRHGSQEEDWEASVVLRKGWTPVTVEVTLLRKYKAWFTRLRAYRNALQHTGWIEQSLGFFEKRDTAQEARTTFHNVLLLPDQKSLKKGVLPHDWTYRQSLWLPDLISETSKGLQELLLELVREWELPVPRAGAWEAKGVPNIFLSVPALSPIAGQSSLFVFISKRAAKTYVRTVRRRGAQVRGALRSLRPIRMEKGKRMFMVAYQPDLLPETTQLCIVGVDEQGEPVTVHQTSFRPAEENGPMKNTLVFDVKNALDKGLYIIERLRSDVCDGEVA